MKFHFDPNQQYQLDAINSIISIFEGQPLEHGDLSFTIDNTNYPLLLQLEGLGNRLTLSAEQILENVNSVQTKNELPVAAVLDGMNFSVEMETGTGKTYVYLRTIYELNKNYGFIELSNGETLFLGDTLGGLNDEVMKVQIRKTVEEHFLKEEKFKDKGIKVLSLFFVDRVANYRSYDSDGNPFKDKFANWFGNAYREAAGKTIYSNLCPLDSNVEYEFARECESRDDIEFYFKLPFWFKIKTPIGKYNPDWALIKKNEKTVYFVAETKSEGQELKISEQRKIKCGYAHFKKFDDVKYRQVATVGELDGE